MPTLPKLTREYKKKKECPVIRKRAILAVIRVERFSLETTIQVQLVPL